MHWNDNRNPLRVHARERGLSGSIKIDDDDDDDNNSEDHDDGYYNDNDVDGDYDDGEENDYVHTNVYHIVDKSFKTN